MKRLLHLASFALSSFPVMLRQVFWQPDVVWVVEPALFCAPQSWFVARLSGAKCWLHIQDFEVDAAFDMGILPPGKLRDLVLWMERGLMRRFDVVSTISTNMLARVKDKGVTPEQVVLFPNWVDTEVIHPLEGLNALRAELGIVPDRIVVLYSGNMGEKQGLEVVLEAARKLQGSRDKWGGSRGKVQGASGEVQGARFKGQGARGEELDKGDGGGGLEPCDLSLESDVVFVMCGDGAARRRLRESYADLPNVLWLPLQPLERLNELLNMADIHLLPQRADVADLVMPSKLTGMLASGRAVIATALPDTQVAHVVRQCGVVCAPGDVEGLLSAIIELSGDAERRRELGRAGRVYAETHLGRDAILQKFENELQSCLAKS